MSFDAWETIWICVAISLLVMLVDAWLANRAGPDKTELARTGHRGNRMARAGKEKSQ